MKLDVEKYLKDLEEIVNTESHSKMPEGTRQVALLLKKKFEDLGWSTELIDIGSEVGPCLKVLNKPSDSYDVLLLGHMDTVFPKGTVAQRPFKIVDGHYTGPGASDMKCGLMYMYHMAALRTAEGLREDGSICLLFNPDEEIGSIYSRPVIEVEAKKAACVMVMESARASGALVNQRKGISKYLITFNGIAAHAGVDPTKGASAINEFIKWGQEILALAAPEKGTTVNIGIIHGGTGANVVAAKAVCEVDVRITEVAEARRIDDRIRELEQHPFDSRVSVTVKGGMKRPPFNPSEASLALCKKVDDIAAKLGIDISWTSTGGGSDGNFTAALGIPTIDGLGPIGGNAHSEREYGEVSSLAPRFELLCEIVAALTGAKKQ